MIHFPCNFYSLAFQCPHQYLFIGHLLIQTMLRRINNNDDDNIFNAYKPLETVLADPAAQYTFWTRRQRQLRRPDGATRSPSEAQFQ